MARRLPALALAVLLAVGAGACSDDGGDDATSTTTTTGAASTTSGATGETTATTAPGSGRPLNESDLVDALLPPEEVGADLAVGEDDTVGVGDFQPALCPDVEVAVTWDDQAARRLVGTGEGGTLAVEQAVLAFADEAAADAFVDEAVAGYVTCDPAIVLEDVADVGERAVRLVGQGDPPTAAGAMVRVGAHVAFIEVVSGPPADAGAVVTSDLLRAAAARLP